MKGYVTSIEVTRIGMKDKRVLINKTCMLSIVALFTGFSCTLLYDFLCIKMEDVELSVNPNYIIFASVIATFFILFLSIFFLFDKYVPMSTVSDEKIRWIIYANASLGGFVAFFSFIREKSFPDGKAMAFIWHKWYIMPAFFVAALLLAIIVDVFAVGLNSISSVISNKKKKICKGLITISFSLIALVFGTFYNYVNSDIYHCNALYTSVYNIMNNQGYTEYSNSIYGFYAILLRIPMLLLGGEAYYNFALLMTLCVVLEYICALYIINKIARNAFVRVLGYTAALWPYVIRVTAGYQVNVMRVLFPMILLAYLMRCISKKDTNTKVSLRDALGSWIIIVLALIWNKESGIICMVSYALYSVMNLRHKSVKGNAVLRWLFILAMMLLSAPVAAFMTVFLYNYTVTGNGINLSVFMFPLMGSSYLKAYNVSGFVSGYNIHLYILFWFLCFVTYGIVLFIKNGLNDEIIIIGISSAMGIGLYIIYFVSIGQVYGRLFTLNFFLVLALVYTADFLLYRGDQGIKILGFIPLIILCSMCISISLQSGHTLYQRAEAGVYNKKDYVHFADMVADSLPADTYIAGIGVQELCSVNERLHMQGYYLDTPDLSCLEVAQEMVLHDISTANHVLTEKETIKRNHEIEKIINRDFEQVNEWTYNDIITYVLYEKIN